MKILSVSAFYNALTPPEGYGGMERFIHYINNSFVSDAKIDATVLCPTGSKGGLYKTLCCDKEKLPDTFKQIVHTMRPDIIHNHMRDTKLFEVFPLNIPVVTTIHANIRKTSSWIPYISNRKNNHFFVAISNSHKERVLEAMRENNHTINDEDIYMCGYGMDITPYKAGKKSSCSGEYYIYIGAIAPYKGVLDVALAFKNTNEKLVIVGPCTNEEERTYFDKVLELTKECKNIDYYGEAKTEDEKIKLLQKAKGSIIASGYSSYDSDYYEAFGLVMLEANAVGVPVIGFNKGNISDYIVDGLNGYKFDNISELPGLIEKVNNTDMLAGSLEVSDRYHISEITKNYIKLFDNIRRL